MERRNFIKSSLGIGLGATLPGMTHSKSGKEAETAVSPAMPVKSGKPHIILIMTDQQRGDALGCMGNKAVISPNIDRLAQEGSLFVSGYSSAPISYMGFRDIRVLIHIQITLRWIIRTMRAGE